MKIGLFDSGLGGLTILKAVARALPQYDYEFYGDTANVPYGDKSEADIYELTKRGVAHLFARDCALVIIACNTASAETTRRLQDEYLPTVSQDRRILGVIIPTVETVAEADLDKVLLIGTQRTIDSHKFEIEFSKLAQAPKEVVAEATPALVPLIEMGDIETAKQEVLRIVRARGEVDGLILGCTHYCVLAEELAVAFPRIKIFSQDTIIPQKIQQYLAKHSEIESTLSREGTRNIFLTDASSRYDAVIRELLGGAFIEA